MNRDAMAMQRHTLRDRRHNTAACPACCMGNGEKGIEILYG